MSATANKSTFELILITPTHYDDDTCRPSHQHGGTSICLVLQCNRL
jgi:hypothetical protein